MGAFEKQIQFDGQAKGDTGIHRDAWTKFDDVQNVENAREPTGYL